jgi:hypothetical protein
MRSVMLISALVAASLCACATYGSHLLAERQSLLQELTQLQQLERETEQSLTMQAMTDRWLEEQRAMRSPPTFEEDAAFDRTALRFLQDQNLAKLEANRVRQGAVEARLGEIDRELAGRE